MRNNRAKNFGSRIANNCSQTSRTRNSRRGILLLVVLSMLTLFLLIGTAFIVTSKQYHQANKTRARLTETSNSSIDQQDLLNEVLNQLLRDTNNPTSSLRFHSLLRDIYGSEGFQARMFDTAGSPTTQDTVWASTDPYNTDPSIANPTGGQMIQFTLEPTSVVDQFGVSITTLSPFERAYNGLVLTFLDGPARGQSVRIVGHTPVPIGTVYNARLRVITPRLADGSLLTSPGVLDGSQIAINGRPFNGTGVGYNAAAAPNSPRLTATEADMMGRARLLSLIPNNAFLNLDIVPTNDWTDAEVASLRFSIADEYFFTPEQLNPNLDPLNILGNAGSPPSREENLRAIRIKSRMTIAGLGGTDESYDAPDFQNMMLGFLQPNPIETVLPDITTGGFPDSLAQTPIPSAHRPALLNYWRVFKSIPGNNPSGLSLESDPHLLRKIMLRPSWLDHPNFDGSNPDFRNARAPIDKLRRMIYGPWDVDNDLDGVRDSVWIDAGLPIMENSDGRLVKPLVSMLVLDMDGRLNLNAHGSEDIANAAQIDFDVLDGELAGGNDPDNLAHGIGYGPAEISLNPIMPGTTRPQKWAWYRRMFQGVDSTQRFNALDNTDPRFFNRRRPGKYGQIPGGTDPDRRPLPGIDNLNVLDIAAQLKMQGVPPRAAVPNGDNSPFVRGSYVTPPDFKGRYALGIDEFGRPVYEAIADAFGSNDSLVLTSTKSLHANTPYEVDLSLGANRGDSLVAPDSPYTMAELERLLRPFDADAGALPPRIWEMAGEFKALPSTSVPNLDMLNLWRTTVTTDSYDLPVPSVVVPDWMVKEGVDGMAGSGDEWQAIMARPAAGASFSDLLDYRIRVGLRSSGHTAFTTFDPANLTIQQRNAIQQLMDKLLPPDLANGLRLDINRPLGNGRDDNNNGVVDEPGEVEPSGLGARQLEAPYWASNSPELNNFTSASGRFRDERILLEDRDNDGIRPDQGDNDDLVALNLTDLTDGVDEPEELIAVHNMRRQLLARDLYVLALTLADPIPLPPGGTTDPNYSDFVERRANRAKKLAQWAINVVDFRDPDNIMTAFEYDVDPFDGWGELNVGIDGSLTTRSDIYGQDQKPGGTFGSPNFDQGGLVWGAETPELLMTETLAWHDRKTIDTRREGEPTISETDSQEKADVGSFRAGSDDPYDASQDQRERPQGIALVELYCPLPENPAASADTHLINGSDDQGVNLAAIVRDPNNNQLASPVWRMTVYKRGGPGLNPEDPNEANRPTDLKGDPKADRSVYFAGFDPETLAWPTPDRWDDDGVAFFNGYDEITEPRAERYLKVPPVRPGRYMVVGAGEEIARGQYLAKFGENNSSSTQRGILLQTATANGAVQLRNSAGTTSTDRMGLTVSAPVDPEDGLLSLSSVAIINQTADNPTPGVDRIFNVSEPAGGYPRSIDVNSVKGFSNSAWDPAQKQYVPIVDMPLDDQRTNLGGVGGGGGIADPLRPKRGALFDDDNRLALPEDDQYERTIPEFSWIYLQRLANPLLPWNPPAFKADGMPDLKHDSSLTVNPYMTVDSMGVNVTVFNGLSERELAVKGNALRRFSNNSSMLTFSSVQRGRYNDATTPYKKNLANIKASIIRGKGGDRPKDPSATPPPFQSNLFGMERFESDSYWKNRGGPSGNGNEGKTSHYFEALPDNTLGYLNEPFRGASNSKIEPETPFPWLTWNNRPFANAGELLLVPAFSGLDLLQTFSYSNASNARLENYLTDNNPATQDDKVVDLLEDVTPAERKISPQFDATLEVDGRYGHLLNFFRDTVDQNETPTQPEDDRGITGLYRILDYVHVPSPFVSTETWLNPTAFGNDVVASTDDPRYLLQPPYNRLSSFRDPGRVNLNTIASASTWDGGIMHRELADSSRPWDQNANNYQDSWLRGPGFPDPNARVYGHAGPKFLSPAGANQPGLVSSRRGYGAPSVPLLQFDIPASANDSPRPTFFANPFRAPDAFDLVPTEEMVEDRFENAKIGPVSASLLRNDGVSTRNGSTPPTLAGDPNSDESFNDVERNPMFRYLPISRLSSMTTNRSNVYAVWITIGFFEVEPAPTLEVFKRLQDPNNLLSDAQALALFNRVYPDGYQFGREAGADTGNVVRVREFAMIDRTIPVAFEPGKNHNVEKAIRLRRRLE